MEPHLDDLRAEARYWRERVELYRAKAYGGRPTTPARLRELERTAQGAEARLRRAEAVDGGGRLAVRVQPRARRDEIVGERDGALIVRVTAPPVDGRANDALRKLLAKRLRVPAGRVSVVRGAASRDKLVEIDGMDMHALRRKLSLPPAA